MHNTFTVTKDRRGQWRWVAISSTAYQDRDQQIVSQKALGADVARADGDGDYGPLLWWHTNGARLGDCDFNALAGKCLIESGTFRDEATAKAIAPHADELALSIGFRHPPDQPDAGGVFHTIRRIERSLLPQHVASNLFTRFGVKGPSMTIDATKAAALTVLLGEDLATKVLADAAATEKAADAAGVAYKEAQPLVINGVTYVPQAPAPAAEPASEAAPPAADAPATTKAEGDTVIVEEDRPAFDKALGDYIIQGIAALLTDMKSGDAQAEATKAASDAAERQQLEQQLTQLTQQQAANATALKAAQDALAELAREQPRVIAGGYRPSRAEDTVVKGADPKPVVNDLTRGADFILGPGGSLS